MHWEMCELGSCIGFDVFNSRNALDGRMDLGLTCYPCEFSVDGDHDSSCDDAATTGPTFCGGVVHPFGDVFEWRHAWGKQVQVGDVRCQLEVVDGEESVGILIRENVGSYGGAKCYSPYMPISVWAVADSSHAGEGGICGPYPCGRMRPYRHF